MEEYREIILIMTCDNENKMCFDCLKPYPQFTSVNNGIFICKECSEIHNTLGSAISYVRPIQGQWDEYLIAFMSRGGNRRLRVLIQDYDIDQNSDITFKYRTNAVEIYRQTVSNDF